MTAETGLSLLKSISKAWCYSVRYMSTIIAKQSGNVFNVNEFSTLSKAKIYSSPTGLRNFVKKYQLAEIM